MKTQLLKWDTQNAARQANEAARILDNGGLVGLPTETVYGIACRAEPSSIARLDLLKGRDASKRYTLHLGKAEQVFRYIPAMPAPAKKLLEKALPGPITLVCTLDQPSLQRQRDVVGRQAFDILYRDGSIGIRCPDHPAALQILSTAAWPIVAPSANPASQKPATSPQQVLDYFDGKIEMVIDAPRSCRYQKSSTVVQITSTGIQILRDGAVAEEDIRSLATVRILFVCTGNTCRSPIAEALCRKMLAEKFGCRLDELEKIGYKVDSFGTAAAGTPASPEARQVCSQYGTSLEGHRSRLITCPQAAEADYIFVMTPGHLEQVGRMCPATKDRLMLLDEAGAIEDPVGSGLDDYRACAEKIKESLSRRIEQIL